jgi:predicted small lipoprotein YifL
MGVRMLLAVSTVLLLAACGQEGPTAVDPPRATPSGPAPTATITAGVRHDVTGPDGPPPFRVRYDRQELVLHPHTSCYNGCVDGVDTDPPDIGSPAEIQVYVPVEQFALSVHARELTSVPRPGEPSSDATCGGRSFEMPVEDLGDGWYSVRASGPAAHYDIELFAQGGGGDMIGSLRWRTPTAGPMPDPSARLALIADHDGEPDSFGLELAVEDLAETPADVGAEIEVTAANGRSMTFAAEQASDRCRSAGDLYFDRPDDLAKQAAGLGDFPFTTTVTLTLDGRTYVATAVYPDHEIEGNEPSVALEFAPELPGA